MGDMMTLGSYPFVLHHETKMAMTAGDSAASIATLWRFPVKSMQGEAVTTLDLRTSGAVGDRSYALIDVATGKVASAKSAKRFPNRATCQTTPQCCEPWCNTTDCKPHLANFHVRASTRLWNAKAWCEWAMPCASSPEKLRWRLMQWRLMRWSLKSLMQVSLAHRPTLAARWIR